MIFETAFSRSARIATSAVLLLVLGGPATASIYTVLHDFAGAPNDGSGTISSLTNVGNNTYYGTTSDGGLYGYGTIFELQGSTETVVYNFTGGADGGHPVSQLQYVNNVLYGTTESGGTGSGSNCDVGGCGTVFKFPIGGTESVLWNFQGGSDGANPAGDLTYSNGYFLGATFGGGNPPCHSSHGSCGTIFSVNATSGAEGVVYDFRGGRHGANPKGGLSWLGGTFYGTTSEGGAPCAESNYRCGIFYRLKSVGQGTHQRVKHQFLGGNASDGAQPMSGVVNIGHIFYGTTFRGGAYGGGTVFAASGRSGSSNETILQSFDGGLNGGDPVAGLIRVHRHLYGVTTHGGGACNCGVIYKVISGGVQNLHSFDGVNDGGEPTATMIHWITDFYGTTNSGGANGYGTIFRFTP